MGYRDEEEGLRAKAQTLQSELDEAKDEISRLKGESPDSVEGEREAAPSRVLGQPLELKLVRELPSAVSDAGLEAIAQMLRERLPPNAVPSQVGGTLSVRANEFEFSLKNTQAGGAQIRVEAKFHHSRNAVFVLAGMFSVIAGLIGGTVAAQLGGSPAHLGWILPATTVGASYLGRKLGQSVTEKTRALYRGIYETAVVLAQEHAVEIAKVRIGDVAVDPEKHSPEYEENSGNFAEDEFFS